MKIEVSENGNLILKEIYSPIGIKTNDGETLILMMRDSGFEVCYENKWFRMQKGEIKSYRQVRDEANKKWFDNNEDAEQCLYDF